MDDNSFRSEDGKELENVTLDINPEKEGLEGNIQNDTVNPEQTDEKEDVTLIQVGDSLAALSKKMDEMNSLFIQKIQHTTHEEKIVDQMHAELQKYKDDMYSQLVRPILMDIIDVRDSILRMSKNYAEKPEGEQDIPLQVFSDYAFDIQEILEKNNITIYKSAKGDVFVPIKQRVVKKIDTTEQEYHGKIAESLSPGYDYLGKTISPEKVTVYLYKEPEDNKGDHE